MYDYLIVTHIPAFYKVNLYNELSKSLKIEVIFIAGNTVHKRADDFIALEKANFKYTVLNENNFEARKKHLSILKLRKLLKRCNYKKIILSGWDLLEFWFLLILNPKKKICLALESSVLESNTSGIKGKMKKIFLSRVSKVFASGKLHVELLDELNYKGEVSITRGVGIINKPKIKLIDKKYKKSYLYVGRLSSEKNLKLLIEVFNKLPEFLLSFAGVGPDESILKKMSRPNIRFLGQIENNKLDVLYQNHNFLILPSLSEPWGLVVEEALYFNTPVIVSKNCGARELISNGVNGFVVDPSKTETFKKTILSVSDQSYAELLKGTGEEFLQCKDQFQVHAYFDRA